MPSPHLNPQHIQALMDLLDRAPYFALLGMHFQAIQPDYCRLTLDLDETRHGNAFGSIHGGVYSSLLDTVAYWAAYCRMPAGQGYTSLDLTVTNLSMARTGTLVAEGRVLRAGRSICLAEATVKDGAGKLLAHGTSKLMLLAGRQGLGELLAAAGGPPLPPKFL